MECRICKDSETVRAKLIAPCICSGSIGLVHRRCLEDWQHYQFSHGTEDTSVCSMCNTAYVKNAPLRSFTLWCISKMVLFVAEPLMLTKEAFLFFSGLLTAFGMAVFGPPCHRTPAIDVLLALLIISVNVAGAIVLSALTRSLSTRMKSRLRSAVEPWVIQEIGDTGWTPVLEG